MNFENIRIKDVHTVVHYRPSVKKWRAQNRKDHFVGIQLSGSVLHTFADNSFVLSGNSIYFFNRCDDYDAEVYEFGDSFTVHFTTYEDIETQSFCIPIENPDHIVSLLQRAEVLKKTDREGDLLLLSTVYKLCAAVSDARQKAYFQKDQRMILAKNYIDLNFSEPNCLAAAIEQSRLSSRRFSDLFRQSFDITPNRYITMRKIEHAKSLLEMQSLTITEIAELCGFSDVYYFCKVFRQICGISPGKWR